MAAKTINQSGDHEVLGRVRENHVRMPDSVRNCVGVMVIALSMDVGAASAAPPAAAVPAAPRTSAAVAGSATSAWLPHADSIRATFTLSATGTGANYSRPPAGASELASFEYGAPTVLSPASAVGKVRAGATGAGTLVVRLVKAVDEATPFLFDAWIQNRLIASVTVQFFGTQMGLSTPMRSYALTDVNVYQIRHFTQPDPAGGIKELEEMLLGFQKLELCGGTGAATRCAIVESFN